MHHRLVLLALLLGPTTLQAQQAAPTCAAVEHHQFDFWAGDWIVTDSSGTTNYGTNIVTQEEAGCLLHEHWTGSRGGTGQSLNFYDRVTGHWAQVWVDGSGTVLRLEGQRDGAAMRLEGDTRGADGRIVKNRIAWWPQPDGRVRQTWSVSQDDGRTWQVSFDGWYRRRNS